jgi:hypothetical protein
MPPGCPERLSWEFIVWVWSYPVRRRPEILARLEAVRGDKQVFVLSSRRDVSRFLSRLSLH